MNTFGFRFKKLRFIKQLTQEELAQDFNKKFHYNFTKSAISQYENDKRFPEVTALIDFADYFNVSIDFLLCRKRSGSKVIEEEANKYVIDTHHDPFRIDAFLNDYQEKLKSAQRVSLFGKTATKRQITIIDTCIEIGLQLAKNPDRI